MERKIKDQLVYFTLNGFGDSKMEHLFSSKIGWDQANIFQDLANVFGLDDKKIYRGTQVHGDKIMLVDRDTDLDELRNMEFDGLLTREPGLALTTYHADCTPLYFYDPVLGLVGMAHSGWRGTYLNMASKMLDRMVEEFGSKLSQIQVGIGPAICKDCYQVKEDVYGLFQEKYSYENIIEEKQGIVTINIPDINRKQLLEAGILAKNLFVADFCTSCNTDDLYSYRKEKTKGRMIASIMLRRR